MRKHKNPANGAVAVPAEGLIGDATRPRRRGRIMRATARRRAVGRLTCLLAALVAVVLVAPSQGASAAVHRPNNAETEIENYYLEFLGRPSDRTGFIGYRNRMWRDCRHGVLAAGMMLGDSREAHRHLPTPQAFVPAMFRALLNRDADPGGYRTYVDVINVRGYRWAIRDIQASPEFRERLADMCRGRRGAATQNELKADQAIVAAIGINDAGMTLVKACAVGAVITLTSGLATKGLYEASKRIKAAKIVLGSVVDNGASSACRAAYKVLQTADDIARSAAYEPGVTNVGYNNPTYVYLNQWTVKKYNGRWCYVQMGAGPSASERSWRQVSFRC